MLSYCCLKYRKNTKSKYPKVERTRNGGIMLLSKFAVSDIQRSKFIKEQKVSRSLSSFGIRHV